MTPASNRGYNDDGAQRIAGVLHGRSGDRDVIADDTGAGEVEGRDAADRAVRGIAGDGQIGQADRYAPFTIRPLPRLLIATTSDTLVVLPKEGQVHAGDRVEVRLNVVHGQAGDATRRDAVGAGGRAGRGS